MWMDLFTSMVEQLKSIKEGEKGVFKIKSTKDKKDRKRKENVQVSSPNLSQMLLERNFLRSRKNKWTNNWKEK